MSVKLKEISLRGFCLAASGLSVLAIALICGFLFAEGSPAIARIGLLPFLAGTTWQPSAGSFGILPMICATGAVTGVALLTGFPAGVLFAIYLAYECPKKLFPFLQGALLLMAGIPSVIYGLFGLTTLVPLIRQLFGGHGLSLLAAGLLLGFMILPTIASVSLTSLKAVDEDVYRGSRALGSSHERTIFHAVLPAARRGILAGLVLGIGRAAGETMAVMMVAGNQAVMPSGLLDGVRTLTANIALEMGYAAGLQREALIATGVVLLVLILVLNLLLALSERKEKAA